MQYNNFAAYLESAFDINTYDRLIIMSVSGEAEGMVLYDYSHDGNEKKAGEYYSFDLDKYPKLKETVLAGSEDIVCEKMNDFPQKGKYYVGCQPLVCNGKTMAIVCVVYNWDSFSKITMATCNKAFLLGLLSVAIASAVLITVLYKKAIRPVSKMKQSVADYMQDKNSSTVQSRMSEISSRNEIGTLAKMFSDLSAEIDRYVEENVKLVGEKKRIDTELELATNIQATQLPSTFPAFPDRSEFDIFASMAPAKEVGGDFYDFFLVDEDHLALVIADVSGNGVPAALFMMKAMMLINNFAMSGLSPKEVMEKANKALCRNNKKRMFVTAWLGIL